MNKPYDEDPPQEALPRRAEKELGLARAHASQFGNTWIVSGFKGRELRLYEMGRDGKFKELTVGEEGER